MRKRSLLALVVLCGAFVLISTVSCSNELKKTTSSEKESATGSISGKVKYSNLSDYNHGGVIVTLDRTDGLRTIAVSKSEASRRIANTARTIIANTVTESDGSYLFSNLELGTYTIYATSTYSKEGAVYRNVVVDDSEKTTIVEIMKLTATGEISGRITIDYNNYGNSGFLVFVAGTSYMAMTDDSGNYTISGIPAGRGYQVVASKDGIIHNLSSSVEVTANNPSTILTNNFSSAELETKEKDGKDGISMVWLGAYDDESHISNPQYLNAYFNMTDGCSYIYNGSYWELLARSGANGNDGEDGQDGKDGKSIHWLGSFESQEALYEFNSNNTDDDGNYILFEPQNMDAYYNEKDGCSYIYFGQWFLIAKNGLPGKDGIGINWLGSYVSDPYAPQYLDAYFNTTDGCSYIYTNNGWILLAQKGEDGSDGQSVNWLGSYSSEPGDAQNLDAYYNETDGCSYIYKQGSWHLLAKAGLNGTDGENLVWLGSFASASEIVFDDGPEKLNAYYNTTDGCSYIYTETGWQLLAKDGVNGKTMNWRGSYTNVNDIANPQNLDAYYNITDGCSYIYNGTRWNLLARKGSDGATSSSESGITWLGTFADSSEIPSPSALDAFYNNSNGCSYIYNGSNWQLLAHAGNNGTNGRDGKGLNWLGSYANSNYIYDPQYLDAYFNTTENCAYIYSNYGWTVLAKGPASGGTGSQTSGTGSTTGANIVDSILISWDNPEGVIRIPNGVTDISQNVFNNKDKITRVIIPSSVESIGKTAFYDCDGLTSVEFLGTGLEIIGESAFESCDNLVSITLPGSLRAIGISAFKRDTKITTVNIPDSVESLGEEAYYGCSMLRKLTIGSGLSILESGTFKDCDALISVTIPDTVTVIHGDIFQSCDSLASVSVSGTWNGRNSSLIWGSTNLTVSELKETSTYYPIWYRE